ncbi:MAD2L1-binding protein [Onthophagus taurus]|uniref:MAD2L1-binding protein n=1 Tax=Onthophagus taurus TaxID=166361 RepID=UPI000C20AE8B|nr:uncharacterized protein LOC111418738 [Onthophagus taurus]
MCNTRKLENTEINLSVNDLVLTPATCALLINEIIKYLVYQKSQIPYPYAWLKNVVSRKRKSGENDKNSNPSVSRNYSAASSAYDIIEEMMKNISHQFKENGDNVKEVMVLFGATPHSPKEMIRFLIPKLEDKHIDVNHVISNEKNKNKVLRSLFLSEEWTNGMELSYPCTNMYLLINKTIANPTDDTAFFLPIRNYEHNEKVPHRTIRFLYNFYVGLCCHDLQIYNNSLNKVDDVKVEENANDGISNYWYQGKLILKGFKDCFINKQSASDLF